MTEPTLEINRPEARGESRRRAHSAWSNSAVTGGVLSTIGNTPLVFLSRISRDLDLRIHAKLEFFNPGGSLKDRPACNMVRAAIEGGLIDAETTIIESSSGNLGIGLAAVCRYFGLRFICVADVKTTPSNIALLRAYGAEVELIRDPDPDTGELLPARLRRVRELRSEIPNSFCPDQYSSKANPAAHHTTMREIQTQAGECLDYVVCAAGTLGLLRGAYEYVRQHRLRTTLIAVDARGSVTFGQSPTKRRIPGHGSAVRSSHYRPDIADVVLHVDDADCILGCRYLLEREAILAGGSSGALVSALLQNSHGFRRGSTVVLVLCDRGERYLDTIYDERWAEQVLAESGKGAT